MAIPTATRTFMGLRRARLVGIFIGLAGLCAALTILFWSMRAVMEIGGSCASGNVPYEITRPCPKGTGFLMTGSIFGGIFMFGLYAVSAVGGPSLWPLAWPALFLSLGWNFFEYGVDPPFGSGVAPGWLICGVLFALMGGAPLLILIRSGWFARLFTGREMGIWRSWLPRLPKPPPTDSTPPVMVGGSRGALLLLQGGAIVFGVWTGWRIFDWANG
ncbi:MAG: hypothetical protein H0V95_05280 [Actinobacteria bacterium]|nr:hypothetical protein [Actinomycetota bacterium]